MDFLLCPKCKSENFKEVSVLLTECERDTPSTHLHADGQKEAAAAASEVCEAPSKNVSYVCEGCGNKYILQSGQLIPTWL